MKEVFGLSFYDKSIECLEKELEITIKENLKASIFTPNVDHIITVNEDIDTFKKYSKADFIIADGWPIVAVAKKSKKEIYRITGVDLMDSLLKIANDMKLNLFFLGAEDDTLKRIHMNITKKYTKINSINFSNGFFDAKDNDIIVDNINKTNTNILFVGMGCPKQELWINENYNKLNANVIIGVGGAFKIYSNEVSRAPKLVQRLGMEWFYRFCKEPGRLFNRYFIRYPKFIRIMKKEFKNEY